VNALIAVLIAASIVAGCGGEKQESSSGESVIAVINGRPVTIEDVQARIDGLPEEARKELDQPALLSAVISNDIRERVWAEAAREAGLDESAEFRRRMSVIENTILARMYGESVTKANVEPTEEEINEIFEQEKGLYANPEIRVRHILCSTEDKAREAIDAIRGGMSFDDAVVAYSEDPHTRDQSGDLGILTRESVIPGYGVAPDFFDALVKLEVGEISGPIRSRLGYHVVLVLNKRAGERMQADALRAQIARRIKRERSQIDVSDIEEELWDRFNVQVHDDAIKRYIGYPVTAEQYVTHIQEATVPGDKIQLCREFLNQFPHNKYAPWVQFKLGFVYSEEMHSHVDAEETFRALLRSHPDSDWAEPAEWMIRNMREEHPPLRSMDEVKALARGDRR
jgi:hypothetical protein